MTPVQKALWYVESHLASELSLDEIAAAAGASRYYITRTFTAVSGQPLMRYVRARRLGTAARALANGAPDILTLALDAGYGSHEAFTRAFVDHFGTTPEAVRAQGDLANLDLVEPIRMDQTPLDCLPSPRFVDSKPLLITGISERYTCETGAGIPAQWQRLLPHFNRVPGQIGKVAYGVCYNTDEAGNMDYLTGVEVPDFSRVPADWARIRLPEQRYVVFDHPGHVSGIRRTWATIWSAWFPSSGHEPADGPTFERYDERFDSQTGNGGLEIWIPLRR
ncbi:MAG TPA: AraC family transcriptional regulator [Steroidobacteraceae bacterium]|nr:AraC family transcriptional regulator [Steroidobacteraceae bacterium]